MKYYTVRGNDPGTIWVHVDPSSPVLGWKLMANDVYDDWLRSIGDKQTTQPASKVFECGGDAVKAVFHSDFCPKYENT